MKKEMKTIIVQSVLLIFQICILIYILSIYKKIDDIGHEVKNIKNNTTSTTEEVKRGWWYYHRCEDIGDKIETSYYETNLPGEDKGLYPMTTYCLGFYYGPSGMESYYKIDYSFLNIMRSLGYSEEEYPYWVREDGVDMFGDYVIIAANIDEHPYGSLMETSLGTGIVCDCGEFSSINDWDGTYSCRVLDISTNWR